LKGGKDSQYYCVWAVAEINNTGGKGETRGPSPCEPKRNEEEFRAPVQAQERTVVKWF